MWREKPLRWRLFEIMYACYIRLTVLPPKDYVKVRFLTGVAFRSSFRRKTLRIQHSVEILCVAVLVFSGSRGHPERAAPKKEGRALYCLGGPQYTQKRASLGRENTQRGRSQRRARSSGQTSLNTLFSGSILQFRRVSLIYSKTCVNAKSWGVSNTHS